ncbi:hypothetical protein F383_10618 [Gossypium arboreum]|uniref:Uncharacterized protein n=1 Tax=Gossypium arboreum TaxID=29729 RepID=A0A0B0PHA8_GOSAR|nr:hypothetical protein F383_10618 [Gossypium arboreum]
MENKWSKLYSLVSLYVRNKQTLPYI